MSLNTAKLAKTISLTPALSYLVVIHYFDSADPATILWAEGFVLPLTATTNDLIARVIERGQTVRAAQANLAAAQLAIPVDATVTIP